MSAATVTLPTTAGIAPAAPAVSSAPTPPVTVRYPLQGLRAGFRRFTVAEYHKMIEIGLLGEHERIELIRGYLVYKMSHNPPHDGTVHSTQHALSRLLPAGWIYRVQSSVTLSASEPEPDGAIVRGGPRSYFTRHPGPADFGIVIEVADSSLASDQTDKWLDYGEAGIPVYWIVNLVHRVVEVYTLPSGPGVTPGYAVRQDYRLGDAIPVVLDGQQVGTVAVADLLP